MSRTSQRESAISGFDKFDKFWQPFEDRDLQIEGLISELQSAGI